MHPCNQNKNQSSDLSSLRSVSSITLTTVNNKKQTSFDGNLILVRNYIQFYDTDSPKYKFLNYSDEDKYYVHLRNKVIIKCDKKFLREKYLKNNQFIKTVRLKDCLIVIDKSGWFKTQSIYSHIEAFFSSLYDAGKSIGSKITSILNLLKEYSSKATGLMRIFGKIDWSKLGDLIISIFLSASTALCGVYGVLQFLYNLFKFVLFINPLKAPTDNYYDVQEGEWEAESFSLEALMAGFSLIGLPSWLLDKIKNFALLTGVKIHASHSFSLLFSKIKDLLISVLSYIFSLPCFSVFGDASNAFINILNYLFSPFDHYDNILLVVEQYTQFIKDSSVLHNPVFRNDVLQLFDKLETNSSFQDYIKNSDNRHFTTTWTAYKDNLVKFVKTYSNSEREEPVCIVFDGPPASGKSVLMNKFVEMLKANNMSVYTHTVPPVDSSKDFYDDYLNQDVFVMDDVGQQGKSQWRTIINFVSPVKYPLDCAQADKKNTKFFQSKVILCTTNNFKNLTGFVAKDSISCPEALFRRVHLIEVTKNRGVGFSQTLTYNKFSDVTRQWYTEFIGPNNVDTKYNKVNRGAHAGDGSSIPMSITTPRQGGLLVSLKWLFALYKHIEESNQIDRNSINGFIDHASLISFVENDPAASLRDLNGYNPQFFDELCDSFNTAWNNLLNGSQIFTEYVTYVSTFMSNFVKRLLSSLFYKVIKPLFEKILDTVFGIGDELKVILSGLFTFVSNLLKGDFIEESEVVMDLDRCVMCLETYHDLSRNNGSNDGNIYNVPIKVLPCGHHCCYQCSVNQMLSQPGSNERSCFMCRNTSHPYDERTGYYVNDTTLAYRNDRNYVKEAKKYVFAKADSLINSFIDCLKSLMRDELFQTYLIAYTFMLAYVLMIRLVIMPSLDPQGKKQTFLEWLFGKNSNDITYAQFSESKRRSEELLKDLTFNTTSAESFKKNHCRIMKITSTGIHTCILVSGKRFLTNSHVDPNNTIVDIYQSYEHMREDHKEMESVKVKVVKNYLMSDVCVCEFEDVIPFYKMFTRFGGSDVGKFSVNTFISPYGIIPLVPSVNSGRNKDKIVYKYRIKGDEKIVTHDVNTGYQYLVQGAGLCGSVIYDNDRVVGIHSTGNGKEGFAQIFPAWLCEELNELLRSKPLSGNFEVRDKIMPQFSGVRLSYNDDVKWKNFGSLNIKTSYLPSALHISSNKSTQELYATIHELQENKSIGPGEVEFKQPPKFGNNPGEVKERMISLSKKSFKHQGSITEEELEYIRKCIRALLPDKIHELSDIETSFGGDNVKGFKKDTSNGFGCVQGKSFYLDFDSKQITKEGQELLDRFKSNALSGTFNEDDFVCRETFKDELRSESKIDKPRLFRVMPFPHVWWTKKLLGELIPWFKKNLHKFGICIGFNPYKDFDTMVKNLSSKQVFGDEDYGFWDGSVLAQIVLAIRDEFKSIYQGGNSLVLDYIMVTIARSFTLIADELYATTHSIPTGTWLTLLLNCLVNKAITALTVYRNNPNATVDDFLKIISYVTGDDKIFGSDESSGYNLLTVKAVASDLGMTVTNGDKTPIVEKSRKLLDLNFLKRTIVYHPVLKRYVGALSISTLFNTVQWYNTDKVGESLTYEQLMRDKCNAVLIESYLHSRLCFSTFYEYFKNNGIGELFTEERVIDILNSDDGYETSLDLLKKNFYD